MYEQLIVIYYREVYLLKSANHNTITNTGNHSRNSHKLSSNLDAQFKN